ncbi:hypothetical protein NKDENANG_00682 [Candidatus Entotheonellaceae bacterium PAL068K]
MRLLSSYIRRTFLRFFGMSLGGCVMLFFIAELFERTDEFLERQVVWHDAARYLAFQLPGIAYQVVPVACLLASVLTFSTLNKGSEIIAMRAAGLAPLRLACPVFVLGGLGGVALLLMQEYLLPPTNAAVRVIGRSRIRHDKLPTYLGQFRQGHLWYRADDGIWSAQDSEPLTRRLLGVTIYTLDAAGRIRQRYDAMEARWDSTGWLLRQGSLRTFKADGTFDGPPEVFAQRHLQTPERFVDVSSIRKQPEEMSSRELLAHARQLSRYETPDARYLTEWHGRFAFAAACVIMAGVGMPMAVHLNRSGGTARAVGLTVLGGFSYWVVYSITMALGANGKLPPLIAAWSTNVCFSTGSLYLAYRRQ